MPRTVRISPVPIPPPPVAPPAPRRGYGLLGVVALLVAVVAGIGHVLLAGAGDHSYDRNATPPAIVGVTAGASYLISTHDGPGAVPGFAPLACTYTAGGGVSVRLEVTAIAASSRATHAVASFVAPVTGAVAIGCSGGTVGSRPVFVDDADDAGTDVAGLLLLLTVLAGLVGVGAVLGASYARTPVTPTRTGVSLPEEQERVSGVTGDPTS